jgi:hypothetical protein
MNLIPLYKLLKHPTLFQTLAAFNNLAIRNKSPRIIGYMLTIPASPVFPPLRNKGSAVTRPASKTMRIMISSTGTSELRNRFASSLFYAKPPSRGKAFAH